MSDQALNAGLKAVWELAFGTSCPAGLAFHGFCRNVITTIGAELNVIAAAAYAGRTPETLMNGSGAQSRARG